MKVRIDKCSNPNYFYADMIGQTVDVVLTPQGYGYSLPDETWGLIETSDCTPVSLKWADLKGTKTAVKCYYADHFKKVIEICDYQQNGREKNIETWDTIAMDMDFTFYHTSDYAKLHGYTVFDATDFIAANTPDSTEALPRPMTTEEAEVLEYTIKRTRRTERSADTEQANGRHKITNQAEDDGSIDEILELDENRANIIRKILPMWVHTNLSKDAFHSLLRRQVDNIEFPIAPAVQLTTEPLSHLIDNAISIDERTQEPKSFSQAIIDILETDDNNTSKLASDIKNLIDRGIKKEAIEFNEWCTKNYIYSTQHNKWWGLVDNEYHSTSELYALYKSQNPKP